MQIDNVLIIFGIVYAIFELGGIAAAVDSIMLGRTTQGAIAWAVSLIAFPVLTLPLYLVFGRSKFEGYVSARRAGNLEINHIAAEMEQHLPAIRATFGEGRATIRLLEGLARMPFTRRNRTKLLIDGEATFDAIFRGIDAAREYILVQFYIVKNDILGREFKRKLVASARNGVRVYFIYDNVGSHKLPESYLKELEDAGVHVAAFNTTRGWVNRLRLNFRNHRKIVICDGRVAYVGGLNVGDEYMGRSRKFGHWRDTHMEAEGPVVQCVQLSFLEDWYWATHEVPDLNWTPIKPPTGDTRVLVLPTGPADELETCTLFFLHAINAARECIWIASPYFVPDQQVVSALQLAALRGVDVRIILPEKPDHVLVWLSSFSYIAQTKPTGVKFYRYQPGFLHHKVMLVDFQAATIGTANFDNRSFRINFEITMLCADDDFVADVRKMLEEDLSRCRLVSPDEYFRKPFIFKMCVRIARLMAPIQ